MNAIIYIAGDIADDIGRYGINEIGEAAARAYRKPVDVLTHGSSKYHAGHRYTFAPKEAE